MSKKDKYDHSRDIERANGLEFGVRFNGQAHNKVRPAKLDSSSQAKALKHRQNTQDHE
jgi:hypothetical protein